MGKFTFGLMKNYNARVDTTEMFSSFGYQLLSSSRVTPQLNSCIDHIWCNFGININYNCHWGPADQFMLEVNIFLPKSVDS